MQRATEISTSHKAVKKARERLTISGGTTIAADHGAVVAIGIVTKMPSAAAGGRGGRKATNAEVETEFWR